MIPRLRARRRLHRAEDTRLTVGEMLACLFGKPVLCPSCAVKVTIWDWVPSVGAFYSRCCRHARALPMLCAQDDALLRLGAELACPCCARPERWIPTRAACIDQPVVYYTTYTCGARLAAYRPEDSDGA